MPGFSVDLYGIRNNHAAGETSPDRYLVENSVENSRILDLDLDLEPDLEPDFEI